MKILNYLCVVTLLFFGCSKKTEPGYNYAAVNVQLTFPSNTPSVQSPLSFSVEFVDLSSGKKTEINDYTKVSHIPLQIGTYDITVNYRTEEGTEASAFFGHKQSEVIQQDRTIVVEMFKLSEDENFVFEEIFISGVLTPLGKQYYGCSYFKIRNNSPFPLSLDSLILAESYSLTTRATDNIPSDLKRDFVFVDAIYMIPAIDPATNKKTKVLEPYQTLLIADQAIDHRLPDPNSIPRNPLGYDLSKADFEWFDESPDPRNQDIDNPAIPNMYKIFAYTQTFWIPHNRGAKAYILFKLDKTVDEFLKSKDEGGNLYEFPANNPNMILEKYAVPNDWIIDAVNLSIQTQFKTLFINPALDRGWTYFSEYDSDKNRYGKSVIRKEDPDFPGLGKLQDTNNSTEDFIPLAPASMQP